MKLSWLRQVIFSLGLVGLVVVLGGLGLSHVAEGQLSLWEALYFTLITVSTVGYSEPPILDAYPQARVIVAVLIVLGVATVAYFNSMLTAVLVEGKLRKVFLGRKMEKKISKLSGHIIVCGCGRTGVYCVQELFALGRSFVAIDRDEHHLERLNEEHYRGALSYVVGDATDDQTLQAAGVERARGLVAALPEDRDNVFVVLSARTLNPKLQIVAKSLAIENEPKLLKAGADKLVSPHRIGGFRLVSELVRPKTMEFLDEVHAMSQSNLHMEDVELEKGSVLVGKTLRTAPIRKESNALVVAIRETDGRFIYSPPADQELRAGSHLVVVGDEEGVIALRKLARGPEGERLSRI